MSVAKIEVRRSRPPEEFQELIEAVYLSSREALKALMAVTGDELVCLHQKSIWAKVSLFDICGKTCLTLTA